jgi:hypothetical protein
MVELVELVELVAAEMVQVVAHLLTVALELLIQVQVAVEHATMFQQHKALAAQDL